MIKCLREEGEYLVRWMIKSAVVFEQVVPEKSSVIPEDVRIMAKNGATTQDFFLMLGQISVPGFTPHLVKGFPVWNGGVYHPYQVHKNGFAFGVYLNHLAIRLVRCPGGSPTIKGYVQATRRVPVVPFWINPPWNYEERVSHAFPSFKVFLDALEVTAQ